MDAEKEVSTSTAWRAQLVNPFSRRARHGDLKLPSIHDGVPVLPCRRPMRRLLLILVMIALVAGFGFGFMDPTQFTSAGFWGPGHRLEPESAVAEDLSPSSQWTPMRFTECTRGMPGWFAPCVAENSPYGDRLVGEELFYSGFAIPFPVFVDNAQRDKWLDRAGKIVDRALPRDDYMVYRSQQGQNYVLSNVEYTPPTNFDNWSPDSCMSAHTTLGGLNLTPRNASEPPTNMSAILINTPDSWSFQHFLDRVTHVISQATLLSSESLASVPAPVALAGKAGSARVQELWEMMGFNKTRILHKPSGPLSLDRIIYSCKTVLIHPFLSWKTYELMGVPWATTPQNTNTTTKKTVMYMSRSNGKTVNGGRQVVNEHDVVAAIQDVLVERGQDEELVHFDSDAYANITEVIDEFSNDVLAIVGPHGGALMNHRFAGPGTLLLEFLPSSRIEYINYEEASLINQTYAAIVVDPEPNSRDNMVIDPEDVRHILRNHLGRERDEHIRMSSSWDLE